MKIKSLVLCMVLFLLIFSACSPDENTTSEDVSVTGVLTGETNSDSVTASLISSSISPAYTPGIRIVASEATSEVNAVTAKTTAPTSLWSSLSDAVEISVLSADEDVEIISIDETFWCKVKAGSSEGYVYTGSLITDGSTVLSQELNRKISSFKENYSNGRYWNHIGFEEESEYSYTVTDTPCDHEWDGYDYCNYYNGTTWNFFSQYSYLTQCLGFASLMSDSLFGEAAPIGSLYSPRELKVGDHIRFIYYEHSVTVVEVGESGVTVAECNRNFNDCMIEWGRSVTFDELENNYGSGGVQYISRYHDMHQTGPSPNDRIPVTYE